MKLCSSSQNDLGMCGANPIPQRIRAYSQREIRVFTYKIEHYKFRNPQCA